ncbi:RHS repeat-associated core domain-containing protein, partial [Burkholderia cepacia]|uniref:RHS repeat-associated core domain-containing protein n=1 Tax=Burkholderia cepacia TaxID=292 RepID=UPI000B203B08
DAAGDVIQKRDQRYGTTNYRYDPTGRIEQAAGPGLPSEVFRWDAAANLVSSDHPGGYVEHNRLKMFEDKRFEYDVYGRLVRKVSGHGPAKELALEYDDWNQLKTVVTKDRLGIATTHFEYDAFGRRIRKLNGSYASTDFLWDGMRLVQETYHDRQGEEALTYLYESNSYVPLARIDQGKPAANDADARDAVYYFHNDVSGLPEELTDAGGDLVWQARYKVWGNAVQEEWVARVSHRPDPAWREVQAAVLAPTHAPRPQNLRFQGQYLDRETGLHYNTFRYYDPDIGRFVNPDPIGLAGGNNLYQYAPNPVSWIDPWGWSCSSDAKELAENLRNRPSVDYRAHHIVMSNSKDPRMIALRQQMEDLGIPLNGAKNGAWLPKDANSRLTGDLSTAHSGEGVHSDAYKQYVFDNLINAKTKPEFIAGLDDLRSDLKGGKTFPTKR